MKTYDKGEKIFNALAIAVALFIVLAAPLPAGDSNRVNETTDFQSEYAQLGVDDV